MKQIRRMLALLLTVCVLLGTCGALADTYREGDAGPEIMYIALFVIIDISILLEFIFDLIFVSIFFF